MQFTVHMAPVQLTSFGQEALPHWILHEFVALQDTPWVHVPSSRHCTVQSLPAHEISPQVLLPVHTTAQRLAAVQSTPWEQAF